MLVKFIDDLLDAQLFLKNVCKMYKSKDYSLDEYIPSAKERIITLKNTNNDVDFVCDSCGLTLADKNDLTTHLKIHYGNKFNFLNNM